MPFVVLSPIVILGLDPSIHAMVQPIRWAWGSDFVWSVLWYLLMVGHGPSGQARG